MPRNRMKRAVNALKEIWFCLFAFTILFIEVTTAHAGTVNLPQTGQARCYDSAGLDEGTYLTVKKI